MRNFIINLFLMKTVPGHVDIFWISLDLSFFEGWAELKKIWTRNSVKLMEPKSVVKNLPGGIT